MVLRKQAWVKPGICIANFTKINVGPRSFVRALIIAPTCELAQQIHDAIGELAKGQNT